MCLCIHTVALTFLSLMGMLNNPSNRVGDSCTTTSKQWHFNQTTLIDLNASQELICASELQLFIIPVWAEQGAGQRECKRVCDVPPGLNFLGMSGMSYRNQSGLDSGHQDEYPAYRSHAAVHLDVQIEELLPSVPRAQDV